MLADDLRHAFLTSELSDEQLAALVAAGEERRFRTGDALFEEGLVADQLWILLDGQIQLSRRSGHHDVPVATMSTPGQWAGGLTAWAPEGADAGYRASATAASDGRAFVIPSADLGRLVGEWLPFAKHLITGIYGTIRSIDATARELAKLAALGEHSARLAHELNNPAAAAMRAAESLAATCDAMMSQLTALGGLATGPEAMSALDALRRRLADAPNDAPGALAAMDREDAIGTWLDARGVEHGWDLASPLAAAGADPRWLDDVEVAVGAPGVGAALRWITTTVETGALLTELADATGRVSRLVDDARSYSQMNRAPLQTVDVHEGIESTLRLLASSLSHVQVERDFAADVAIDAFASELNQVWTNLVVNAVDAMDGRGVLRISTRSEGDDVVIEFTDDGPGIPADVLERAFEPFFTTKDVGKGTGLGLDIARRIVVDRHGGEIRFESVPGATTARVRLPQRR